MLQQVINNLLQDVSVVQRYIVNSQDAGFNDMTRLLEGLSIKLFGASHGLRLVNLNRLKVNFPAIDLADDKAKVAVQVTSNADRRKINQTLDKFLEYNLDAEYDRLIVHGFVNCVKPKDLSSYCVVVSIGDIVSAVADKHDEDLVQDLVDAIQQHTDFARIHPYDDLNCLEIVLRCIDRNAIKHRIPYEGSFKGMVDGLNEITELISKGTIKKKRKSKSLDDFTDLDIVDFMGKVRHKIGEIVAIANKNLANPYCVSLPWDERGKIDALKFAIMEMSNEIAIMKDLKIRISPIGE